MKYYQLEHTNDPEVTGTTNPSTQVNRFVGMTPEKDEELTNLSWKIFPEKINHLDKLLLKENANITDFIDQTLISCGFIISSKAKSICDRLILVGHQYYPAVLRSHKKDKKYNYFLLYLTYYGRFIDYYKSKFSIRDIYVGHKKLGDIFLGSEAEHVKEFFRILKNRDEGLRSIFPERLIFTQSVDIFCFPYGHFYASQKTKDLFETEGITGIKFIEAFEAEVVPTQKS